MFKWLYRFAFKAIEEKEKRYRDAMTERLKSDVEYWKSRYADLRRRHRRSRHILHILNNSRVRLEKHLKKGE